MKPYESHTMPPQKIVVIHLLDINYSLLIHRRLELKHYVSNYFYLNLKSASNLNGSKELEHYAS